MVMNYDEELKLMKDEVLMLKDLILEMNASMIQEMASVKEVMVKNNEIFSEQIKFMKGFVVVMFFVLCMFIVKEGVRN